MLFSNQRRHALSIPAIDKNSKPVTIAHLIEYLCENTMRDTRQELFVLEGQMYVISDAPPLDAVVVGLRNTVLDGP